MSHPRRRGQTARLRLTALEDRTVPAGVPALHSLPGAPVALYLDFDGYANGSTTYAAYSEDANFADFNAAEQASIIECWRQVSAYYAAFDVDVTTERPPASQPTNYALISNSVSNAYSYSVFPATTPMSFVQGSYARTRASAVAHELGHNFGLYHQSDFDTLGQETREYSSGPDPLHVPVMG